MDHKGTSQVRPHEHCSILIVIAVCTFMCKEIGGGSLSCKKLNYSVLLHLFSNSAHNIYAIGELCIS